MPKNILFFPDVYKEHGHWLPAISLAQGLRSKYGHKVEFMGIADCEPIVEPYGFKFHKIFEKEYPAGYTKSFQHGLINDHGKFPHLWNIIDDGLKDLLQNKFKPHLIISGYFTSLETLLLYYKYMYSNDYKIHDTKFMFTTTFLRHPTAGPETLALQVLVSMSEPMLRKVMRSVCGGTVDVDTLSVHDFIEPIKEMIELVPCPRQFEFDNYRFETGRVEFIEPCIVKRGGDPNDLWEVGIPPAKLRKSDKRIIFATAGSQTQDYKDMARRWFQEMIKMMGLQGMQDYHLVMSVGDDLFEEDWAKSGALPENVTAHSWVSQLDVLNYCAAAYVHGGLATVKECIYKNVPIIVLPLGKDQMDNAMRVVRSGIGQTAHVETVNFNDLQYLFLQATTNEWMRTKLSRMNEVFVNMERDPRPGVDRIHRYVERL